MRVFNKNKHNLEIKSPAKDEDQRSSNIRCEDDETANQPYEFNIIESDCITFKNKNILQPVPVNEHNIPTE